MSGLPLDRIRAELRNVKVPSPHSRIYKDECIFSFAGPESQEGIFVNLNTWQGVGSRFLDLDHKRTGNVLYFNERHRRVPNTDEEMRAKDSVPTKMKIGGDEGFQVDQKNYTVEKDSSLVLMPDRFSIPLPCPGLPELILTAIAAIEVRASGAALACSH